MRSFWSEPYLWVHLAGAATLPILLELCVLALGAGEPFLPVSLEFLLVAIAGITPILWMQWQRPFCIFSLVFLALQPSQLTEDQRRLLNFFKTQETRLLSGVAALSLIAILWQLFQVAPLTIDVAFTLPGGRFTSLMVAAIAFLLCNLFLQVPVSVMRVLAVSETQIADATPYPADRIAQDFTLIGLRVKQILPEMKTVAPSPASPARSGVPPSTSAVPWPGAVPTEEGWAEDEDDHDDEFSLSEEMLDETAAQLHELASPAVEAAAALDNPAIAADLPSEAWPQPEAGVESEVAVPEATAADPDPTRVAAIDPAEAEASDMMDVQTDGAEGEAEPGAEPSESVEFADLLTVVESAQDIPPPSDMAAAVDSAVLIEDSLDTPLEEAIAADALSDSEDGLDSIWPDDELESTTATASTDPLPPSPEN